MQLYKYIVQNLWLALSVMKGDEWAVVCQLNPVSVHFELGKL